MLLLYGQPPVSFVAVSCKSYLIIQWNLLIPGLKLLALKSNCDVRAPEHMSHFKCCVTCWPRGQRVSCHRETYPVCSQQTKHNMCGLKICEILLRKHLGKEMAACESIPFLPDNTLLVYYGNSIWKNKQGKDVIYPFTTIYFN